MTGRSPSCQQLDQLMQLRSPLILLAATLALATTVAAQANPRIVGLTRTTPLVVHQDTVTCNSAQCSPGGFPPTTAAFAGGTAYDGRTRGVWISQGSRIAKVDTRNQCIYQCPPMPMPNTSSNLVTGLAYNELTNTLFATDLSGVIRWYSVGGGCQLSLVSRCIAPIGSAEVITGVATDDYAGLIFWCTVVPGTAGGRVYVAQQGAPCNFFCQFPVRQCGTSLLGPLSGLGYDSCRKVLWVTDGRRTVGGAWDAASCSFVPVSCCVNGAGEPYVGLCVMPGSERSSGFSCTASTCPSCPTLRHLLGSEPTVGNPAFSLDLTNAPANTNAYLILNLGACTAPGLFSPPFCAPILVPFAPPPLIGGPMATGGGAGCTGSASQGLPVPNNPALCGVMFSSQFVGVCFNTAGVGTYVSNCLTWTVSGF